MTRGVAPYIGDIRAKDGATWNGDHWVLPVVPAAPAEKQPTREIRT